MLVRPARKRLFCLKAKNGLGRFAISALPHYYIPIEGRILEIIYVPVQTHTPIQGSPDDTVSIDPRETPYLNEYIQ